MSIFVPVNEFMCQLNTSFVLTKTNILGKLDISMYNMYNYVQMYKCF